MKYIIEMYDLVYSANNKIILNNINLKIKQGEIVNLVSKNNSAKTTLLKLLGGYIITDNQVKIEGIKISNFNMEVINTKVSFITSNNEFFSKTVLEEILQDNVYVSLNEINKVKKYLYDFNVPYLLNMSPLDLSYAENQIVSIIKFIIKNPKILLIDNAFNKFDIDKKTELLKYLINYCKENNITLIYSSNNLNDYLLFERIIILNKEKIFIDKSSDELFLDEKKLHQASLRLPFIRELNDKLKMYDLIHDDYNNIDEMVDDLCK